jgi:hypothetical protein
VTADELLAIVKDGGALPPAQTTLTDSKILTAMDSAMRTAIVPWLHGANGNYFLDSKDYTILASTAGYTVPERSMGLDCVKVVDTSGNELPKLEQYTLSEVDQFQNAGDPPAGFYFTASQVILLPKPGTSPTGSIRIYYRTRPGAMVADTVVAAQHTAVGIVTSLTATVITLNANHNGWPANTTIDLTAKSSPYRLLAKDVATTTAAAGTATIAVATDLTALVAAGDYVTLARTSYVPQVPQEWHEVLQMATISKLRRYLKDYAGASQALAEARMMADDVIRLYRPRASQNQKRWGAWGL